MFTNERTNDVTLAVGRIDYMGNNGEIYDSTEYTNKESLRQDLIDELNWYVDVQITLYQDENGDVMDVSFLDGMRHKIVASIEGPHVVANI